MLTLTSGSVDNERQNMTVAAFRDWLSEKYYPELSLLVKAVTNEFTENMPAPDGLYILNKFRQELDIIEEKEQETIFPMLLTLEKQSKKTDCKLFKLTDVNYSAAMLFIQQLKLLSTAHQALHALDKITDMETAIIQLRKTKEKYLFKRFKSCSGSCKVYEQSQH